MASSAMPAESARKITAKEERRRREKPTHQEEGHCRRWHQTPAQIVEYLPAVENGKRIGFNPTVAQGHARLEPVNDLPVAANPAVLPAPPRDVTIREDI